MTANQGVFLSLCLPFLLGVPEKILAAESEDDVAIELINPISSMASIFNGFSYRSYDGSLPGAGDQNKRNWDITPSIPFSLENGKTIVVRATFPISFGTPAYLTEGNDFAEWQIRKIADSISDDGTFAIGHGHLDDISYDIAYGGVNDDGLITMIGLAGLFPVNQDGSIERDQYLLGPELALGKITDWGIYGLWFKHLTDVANVSGNSVDWDTNDTSLKLYFAYGLGNGWNIISNPVIEYDWEGANGNKLALPLGGGISKTTQIGRVPLKLDLELYHYLESPDSFGPEWLLSFSLTPAHWGR